MRTLIWLVLAGATLAQTPDGQTPSPLVWNFWAQWVSWQDYLVIERVNLMGEYQLINFSNSGGTPGSYTVTVSPPPPAALITVKNTVQINPGYNAPAIPLVTGVTVNLYSNGTGTGAVDYTYVVSTDPRNLVFDGTHWTAK